MENIEIELNNQILNINCGNYKAKINCLDAEDFPIIPQKKDEYQFSIINNKLRNIINKTLSSISLNDIRIEFTGVNLFFAQDMIYFASTDSYRLSEYEAKINTNKEFFDKILNNSIIIPAETLREINKIICNSDENDKILITIENNQIFFDINDIKVVSRLINGKFPPYKQIIPNDFKTTILINKVELLQSIKIASVFTKKIDGEINISIEDNKLKIESELQESGKNQIDLNIEKNGENQNFILNPKYLIDGLNVIDSLMVKIMVNNSNSPIVLRSIDEKEEKILDNFIYIIMPIRK
jgi:DNA polymerase-3 subunit beta